MTRVLALDAPPLPRGVDEVLQPLVDPLPGLVAVILVARGLVDQDNDAVRQPIGVGRLPVAPDHVGEFHLLDVLPPEHLDDELEQQAAAGAVVVLRDHDDRRARYPRERQLVAQRLLEPRPLAVVRQQRREEFAADRGVAVLGQFRPQVEVDVVSRRLRRRSATSLSGCVRKPATSTRSGHGQPGIDGRDLGDAAERPDDLDPVGQHHRPEGGDRRRRRRPGLDRRDPPRAALLACGDQGEVFVEPDDGLVEDRLLLLVVCRRLRRRRRQHLDVTHFASSLRCAISSMMLAIILSSIGARSRRCQVVSVMVS